MPPFDGEGFELLTSALGVLLVHGGAEIGSDLHGRAGRFAPDGLLIDGSL